MDCLTHEDEALAHGLRLLEEGDFSGAVSVLTVALAHDPRETNSWQKALYDPTVRPEARQESILFHRAVALRRLRRYVEAIHDCNRLVILNPTHGPAFMQRGLCYLALGVPQRAERDLRAALSLASEEELALELELPELMPFLADAPTADAA